MSRVTKSIKNAKVGVLFYSLVLIAHFFSRKVFLESLGDSFIGLVGTLQSILGLLNLAEMGIGTAVGFALYKPIFDENKKEINNILSLTGFLYKRIGIGILVVGIIVSFFFPLIFSGVSFSLWLIYFAFFSFLASSLLGYFVNYHLILLEADQKSYIVTAYFQTANILRLIFQSLLAYYFQNLFIWVFLELSFGISYAVILRLKIAKEYPWLILSPKTHKSIMSQYKEITLKIKQTFVHKIGAFVLGGTDQLLIFALVNINSVAFFGNYQMIFNQVANLLNNLFKGSGASVGNLVAENDQGNIDKIFWEMMALRFFFGGFICINVYFLLEPFIILWLGEKYILDSVVLYLMIGNFMISQIRVPVEQFRNAYGLFQDTWAPIIEIFLNLGISIILGIIMGISGIMLGTFVSLIAIVVLWKPYFLYKNGFERPYWQYWINNSKLLLSFSLSFLLISYLSKHLFTSHVSNYLAWVFTAFKLSLLVLSLYGLMLYSLNKGFRDLIRRFKKLIGNRFNTR